ncbi:MAG: hypothetical protein U0936_01960 [Planctomycetaceae bacterium]
MFFSQSLGATYLVFAVYVKVITAGNVRVGDLITKMNDTTTSASSANY